MGCFSWLDCCQSNKAIRIGDKSFALVPEKFIDKYGERIEDSSYDGYGRFGGYDIYDLVAIWNKDNLSEDYLEPAPKLEQYGGLWNYQKDELRQAGKSEEEVVEADKQAQLSHYNAALSRRNRVIKIMNEFKAGRNINAMREEYGYEFLRNLGIAIACHDRQNKRLRYPIKITHDSKAVYEDCVYSKGDPNQGCF